MSLRWCAPCCCSNGSAGGPVQAPLVSAPPVPYACPAVNRSACCPSCQRVTTTALMTVDMSPGGSALTPLALQALADYIQTLSVIYGVTGQVKIYPPMLRGGSYAYMVRIEFPLRFEGHRTVDGVECPEVLPVFVPEIAKQCGAFSEGLNAQLTPGQPQYDALLASLDGLLQGQAVDSIAFTPFTCRVPEACTKQTPCAP